MWRAIILATIQSALLAGGQSVPEACLARWQTEAQSLLPENGGDRVRLSANIEIKGGYISGVCVMLRYDEQIKCSLFNEFGISVINFTYDTDKDRIKIAYVVGFMDRWYVRRTLKKDLRQIIHNLKEGLTTYINEKRDIRYEFAPLCDVSEGEILGSKCRWCKGEDAHDFQG